MKQDKMKKILSFEEFKRNILESALPDWAKPQGDANAFKGLSPNFQRFRDEKQSMTRFQPGDVVQCNKPGPLYSMIGKIISMEGGRMITLRTDWGQIIECEPEYLIKVNKEG